MKNFFGAGTGQIWLDSVFCAGTELRLVDCPANPIGDHNCYHRENVGVRCQEIETTTPISTTTPAAGELWEGNFHDVSLIFSL